MRKFVYLVIALFVVIGISFLVFRVPNKTSDEYIYVGANNSLYQLGTFDKEQRLEGRKFKLQKQDADLVTFQVEGLTQPVALEIGRNKPFPQLTAVVSDTSLEAIQKRWLGKQIWGYGGFKMRCQITQETTIGISGELDSSMSIKSINLIRSQMLLSVSGDRAMESPNDAGNFAVTTPIMVQFEKLEGLKLTWEKGAMLPAKLEGKPLSSICPNPVGFYAADWQLKRLWSQTPAPQDIPRDSGIKRGMNRLQVAWLWGFPSLNVGTRDEVMKLDTWEYTNFPFPATIAFKNGVVSQIDIPRLP